MPLRLVDGVGTERKWRMIGCVTMNCKYWDGKICTSKFEVCIYQTDDEDCECRVPLRAEIEKLQAELEAVKEFHKNYEERSRGYVRTIEAELSAEKLMAKAGKGVADELQAELEKKKEEIEFYETRSVPANTPGIVCLCGSTRFMDAFFDAGWDFTLKGYIVLSVGVCKHAKDHGGEALGQEVADKLDELHLRKIDLADSVYVLNVKGYIGDSTRKEIEYAKFKDKPIRYFEALKETKDD